jgi:hypothetical protein
MGFRRIKLGAQAPYIVLLMAVDVSASELHSLPIMTSFHVFKIALNIYNKPNPNERLIGVIIDATDEESITTSVPSWVLM